MATIRQMYSGVYSMYKSQYINGQLYRSTLNNNRSSSNNFNSLMTNWNSSNMLSGLSMINSNVRSVISSYDTAKNTFNAELDSNLNDLNNAASKIKTYDFNVGEDTNKLNDAVKTVNNFVDKYNDTINFFKDNGSVSLQVNRMASVFGDTTYRAAIYDTIGVNVNKDGTLNVDEDKLSNAITNSPDKVSQILGKNGLAGKAESHVSLTRSMSSSLFPSASSMIGNDLKQASIYTGSAFLRMNNLANIGNLISLML